MSAFGGKPDITCVYHALGSAPLSSAAAVSYSIPDVIDASYPPRQSCDDWFARGLRVHRRLRQRRRLWIELSVREARTEHGYDLSGNALMHRAITNESIWRVTYALIIVMEGLTALLLGLGAGMLLRRLNTAA